LSLQCSRIAARQNSRILTRAVANSIARCSNNLIIWKFFLDVSFLLRKPTPCSAVELAKGFHGQFQTAVPRQKTSKAAAKKDGPKAFAVQANCFAKKDAWHGSSAREKVGPQRRRIAARRRPGVANDESRTTH
jgi:hypothetical protein